jgi:hypothetical protein
LLFTAIVRGGVLFMMRGNLEQDPDAYREIAENVLAHGVYGLGKNLIHPPTPTAYRPPLYPIVLSNLPTADGKQVALWKVAVLHVLLGMGTVWLTYLTAKRVGPSGPEGPESPATSIQPQVAHGVSDLHCFVAALLVVCDPILLNQQTLVMTETLATLLAILSLWCLVRYSNHRYWWNAALTGGAIGLAALCRPTFLPWLGLVAVVMLISDFRFRIADLRNWVGRALPNVLALVVAAVGVMSPWAIRNQQVFGKPMLTTTHGGYTLWLGNNPSFYQWLEETGPDSRLPWEPPNSRLDRPSDAPGRTPNPARAPFPTAELEEDEFEYVVARRAIQRFPNAFIRACLYRITQLWSPLPNKLTADESTGRRLLRYGTAAWYVGVYLLAAVGVWRLRWRLFTQPWVWGVLLCFAFTAVHTLYWCNLRMRAPLMPFVALVAATGVSLAGTKPGPGIAR